MDINQAIEYLEKQNSTPSKGLVKDVFLFISRMTPLVNVDLLIKDEKDRTLLAWRDDPYTNQGWYIPGGIIRYKETLKKRIIKVAKTEIGVQVKFDPQPIAINEIILKKKTRGHFISFLYRCYLPSSFVPENKGLSESDAGYLKWHESRPPNLLKTHYKYYRSYI